MKAQGVSEEAQYVVWHYYINDILNIKGFYNDTSY